MSTLSSDLADDIKGQYDIFKLIVDETINEIYVFDAATLEIIFANKSARRNLGYEPDELREISISDIKSGYTTEHLKRSYRVAFIRWRRMRAAPFWVSVP
jgi:hypothetical protein